MSDVVCPPGKTRKPPASAYGGVPTGLVVCGFVVWCGAALSTLAAAMTRLPQVLVNVRLARKVDLAAEPGVLDAVRTVEAELGDRGRVLVRSSGTEPLLRVMVEAPSASEAESSAARIVAAIHSLEGEGSPDS